MRSTSIAPKRLANWRGVHGKRYTYARYYKQDPEVEMLYDLKTDPDQLTNLAGDPKHADRLKKMRRRTDSLTASYARPEIEQLDFHTTECCGRARRADVLR